MANPIVHFEVQAKDTAKQTAFYKGLLGWSIDANNPMNYGIDNTGGQGIDGGIGSRDATRVTFYVEVDDLQAYLDNAIGMGDKLVMPVTESPVVTLAQFTDPESNVIGLVKSGQM